MAYSKVRWWLLIDREAEDRWRTRLGPADMDAWFAAHGWDSKDVASGSVMVAAFDDGEVWVSAEIVERDDRGRPICRRDRFVTRLESSDYRRSLPEGIASVQRPA